MCFWLFPAAKLDRMPCFRSNCRARFRSCSPCSWEALRSARGWFYCGASASALMSLTTNMSSPAVEDTRGIWGSKGFCRSGGCGCVNWACRTGGAGGAGSWSRTAACNWRAMSLAVPGRVAALLFAWTSCRVTSVRCASMLLRTTLFFRLTLRLLFFLPPSCFALFWRCSGGELDVVEVVVVLGLLLLRRLLRGVRSGSLGCGVHSRYAFLLLLTRAAAAFLSVIVLASELLETAWASRAVPESLSSFFPGGSSAFGWELALSPRIFFASSFRCISFQPWWTFVFLGLRLRFLLLFYRTCIPFVPLLLFLRFLSFVGRCLEAHELYLQLCGLNLVA